MEYRSYGVGGDDISEKTCRQPENQEDATRRRLKKGGGGSGGGEGATKLIIIYNTQLHNL